MELDRDGLHLQPLLDTMSLGLFEKFAEGLSAGKSEAAPHQYCLVQTGSRVTVPRCFYSDCFVSCHKKASR